MDRTLTTADEKYIEENVTEDEPVELKKKEAVKIVFANTPVNGKLKIVNAVLERGEPNNVSVDSYSGYSGYKPQYVIDAMNAVFGIGAWGFEELSNTIESVASAAGGSQVAVAQVKVWIEGVKAQPVGYGQSRVTKGDIGDAKKGAQTDAIKKALSYFSIGNRAYHGLLKGITKGETV